MCVSLIEAVSWEANVFSCYRSVAYPVGPRLSDLVIGSLAGFRCCRPRGGDANSRLVAPWDGNVVPSFSVFLSSSIGYDEEEEIISVLKRTC